MAKKATQDPKVVEQVKKELADKTVKEEIVEKHDDYNLVRVFEGKRSKLTIRNKRK